MARIDFRYGTKRYFIAQYAENGTPWVDCYYALRDKVRAQEKPWIFTANPPKGSGGRRTPKAIYEQLGDLKHEVRRVYALLNRNADDADVDTSGDEIPKPDETPVPDNACDKCGKVKPLFHDDATGLSLCEDCLTPELPDVPQTKRDEVLFFVAEWRRIRKWISQRATATGATPVDSLDSMRPVLEAMRGIVSGISAKALLFSMCAHWSIETRHDAGIADVDFHAEADGDLLDSTHHKLTGYVAKLAEARIPILLVGAAGTGKSRLLRKLATEILELPYGETPMTAGATPSWLLGRHTINGYQVSHFLEIYSNGGVFNFEEIDASDPNMLIVVNNALALQPGEEFFNPVNGETYTRHPDFIPAATANTFGLGANAQYTGRERLDFATIDRFRMGRVVLSLDEKLVDTIVKDTKLD